MRISLAPSVRHPRQFVTGAFVLSAALALTACAGSGRPSVPFSNAAAGSDPTPRPAITVDAVGTVQGTPDTVTVVLGVETGAPKAADALTTNSQKTGSLIKVLKDAGVADKDLTTSALSLNPQYGNYPTIRSYQANNTVTARIHGVDGAGAIVDKAVTAVGDAARLQGVSFSIEDTSSLVSDARRKAVGEAKAKAGTLADAAGVKLGAVRTISESTQRPNPVSFELAARPAGGGAAGSPVPLQAGSQDLAVTVSIVYEIAY